MVGTNGFIHATSVTETEAHATSVAVTEARTTSVTVTEAHATSVAATEARAASVTATEAHPTSILANEASPSASTIALPTRIITYAWGEDYLELLLSVTIPALLAPGNLPYVAGRVTTELVLLTEERFFAELDRHPIIDRLSRHC